MARAEVLLLIADRQLKELFLSFLRGLKVTIAASTAEATVLLRRHKYGLYLATHCGIGPHDAVASIPMTRDYPVLFLTGYCDDEIAAACIEKGVPRHMLPVPPTELIRELKLALDDPRVGDSI